jgi:hypothetical protein
MKLSENKSFKKELVTVTDIGIQNNGTKRQSKLQTLWNRPKV